jgi:hypothetical protein
MTNKQPVIPAKAGIHYIKILDYPVKPDYDNISSLTNRDVEFASWRSNGRDWNVIFVFKYDIPFTAIRHNFV